MRVPRRLLDRLLSMFVLVHRYRCPCFSCQWEGNICVHSPASTKTITSPVEFKWNDNIVETRIALGDREVNVRI